VRDDVLVSLCSLEWRVHSDSNGFMMIDTFDTLHTTVLSKSTTTAVTQQRTTQQQQQISHTAATQQQQQQQQQHTRQLRTSAPVVPPLTVMRPMVSSICIVLLFAAVAFAARTVVITGANRGIGFATVQKLLLCNQQARDSGNANACWDIVMACRSPAKAEAALKKLGGSTADNIRVEELDLASFASIESFASRWGKMPIDCLALNAGIQPSKSLPL
jgi:hypothetical protein